MSQTRAHGNIQYKVTVRASLKSSSGQKPNSTYTKHSPRFSTEPKPYEDFVSNPSRGIGRKITPPVSSKYLIRFPSSSAAHSEDFTRPTSRLPSAEIDRLSNSEPSVDDISVLRLPTVSSADLKIFPGSVNQLPNVESIRLLNSEHSYAGCYFYN